MHGNLNSVRCFVDTKDIMRAYWLAATKCRFGEAYNIGGSCIRSVREVLRAMWQQIVTPSPLFICEPDPSLMRPADVTMQVPDCSKFKEETGWTEHFDMDKVLRELLEHYRSELNLSK